jgi:PAB1-binding protein PBP1
LIKQFLLARTNFTRLGLRTSGFFFLAQTANILKTSRAKPILFKKKHTISRKVYKAPKEKKILSKQNENSKLWMLAHFEPI